MNFHQGLYGLYIFNALVLISACSGQRENHVELEIDTTQYVNTFIGTGGHGHTFPGATTPYGMVQLSPDTRTLGWDACGGYHYTDSTIMGFSHTHLSGTGISDLGDILFMPFSGEPKTLVGSPEEPDAGYRSRFSHDNEESEPGYYSVLLSDYDIKAELTATKRVGFHRYTYQNKESSGIIIDLSHTIYEDKNPDHEIKIINDTEIAGFKRSSGWAEHQVIFFHAKFNRPFSYKIFDKDQALVDVEKANSNNLKVILSFDVEEGGEVLAKVGISSVDYVGAKLNLDTEIIDWNFEKIKEDAKKLWSDELGKIKVKGGSKDEKTIFYTALYHTSISPNTFSDVDGRYRGMDRKVYSSDRPIYTVFSLWDTFRAYNPLKTITDPHRTGDFVNTLLDKYDQGGVLPMWELHGNYTGCMIGYHSVPVIVDAYKKGIRGYDIEKAYRAIVDASKYDTTGVLFPSERVKELLMPKGKWFHAERQYIPADLENESVSKALEYAYNDWCIAQMANEMGRVDDYNHFMERSKKYREYFDAETGFMRGKNQDGEWREPFDPRFSRHRKDDYTEGNAYQWSWFVPHDIEGLVSLMGGKKQFIKNLDELFSTSSELTGEEVSNDISGLIGQYAHGNEPSHHIAHIYNFVGEHWKTQKLTDSIMSTLYFNDPNGLAGNEDCGQMSAWYVLNAMGFYSFLPGNPQYSIGRPLFDKTEIELPNGNRFTVLAKNNSPKNKYVQSIKLNGKNLEEPFFTHGSILKGARIEFEMGPTENKELFN